jgi:hypothetical protein
MIQSKGLHTLRYLRGSGFIRHSVHISVLGQLPTKWSSQKRRKAVNKRSVRASQRNSGPLEKAQPNPNHSDHTLARF